MPEFVPIAVYILCAATSLAAAVMLYRGFSRSGARFLLWSSLCFVGLAINNLLLFIDVVLYPERTLLFFTLNAEIWRSLAALAGMALLLFGLVWEAE